MKHSLSMSRPCVRYLTIITDIRELWQVETRRSGQARRVYTEAGCGEERLEGQANLSSATKTA